MFNRITEYMNTSEKVHSHRGVTHTRHMSAIVRFQLNTFVPLRFSTNTTATRASQH
ncbi:uncharacterized protein B0I36DRAFT_30604 [Microdochium trichocladiopsis]|uniref:Uncharacterized protein n=1 Tax=Microdochium trichocladiopsis TaxID=1682393 RepID=A0A9P9BNV6_9PEZI|nr:uncharacterized protein B0I36DRAFT_30604 [Microdochium trichocladiopsis]KAH7021253.1 hypothetical protein B0I36DRAFT_30604 [Microdochium trichocladiopsis]